MAVLSGFNPAFSSISAFTLTQLDATADFFAARVRTRSTDPFVKIEWRLGTVNHAAAGSMGIVLTADNDGKPNVSVGVPVDVGGGSPTLVSIDRSTLVNNTDYTTTLTNSFTPTTDTWYWVVFYPVSGTWDGSNRVLLATSYDNVSDCGDEQRATSTDTGATWTMDNTAANISYLTTADAYLPTIASCRASAVTVTSFDDADNPDEHGCAWDVPANIEHTIYGVAQKLKYSASTADFIMNCHEGNTSKQSRSIDASALHPAATIGRTVSLWFDDPATLAAGTVGRVSNKGNHASATVQIVVIEFGSQARRESALLLAGFWYCHQNNGGGFTDDKTMLPLMRPIISAAGTGGGGGDPFPSRGIQALDAGVCA